MPSRLLSERIIPGIGILVFIILSSLLIKAEGANHYIRTGANGINDGSDWNNAFVTIPKNLIRGDVYYIATGEYLLQSDQWGNGAYLFNDPEEGEKYITIKKATANDHGTESGWQSEYGIGTALFTATGTGSIFAFITSYYIFDGQTGGGPDNWGTGYGFKIKGTHVGQNMIDIRGANWHNEPMPSHITIAHTEIEGREAQPDSSTNENGIIVPFTGKPDCGLGAHNISIRYCYLHDFIVGQPLLTNETVNFLFEYNYVARLISTPANHSEGWQDVGSDSVIARNNIWEDFQGTAAIAFKRDVAVTNNDWKIYGNVFMFTPNYKRDGVGMGVVCATNGSAPANNILFYNNTIINVCGFRSGIYIPEGTGNKAYNNIWYRCSDYYRGGTANLAFEGKVEHDYNIFIQSELNSTASVHEKILQDDPFEDWEKGNYELKQPIGTGLSLDSIFSHDAYGMKRGSDNNWDCGAYEFLDKGAGADTNPITENFQCVPNPFSDQTTLIFNLKTKEFVSIKIYDQTGKEIKKIAEGEFEPGAYSFILNGLESNGGIYLCQLTNGTTTETKKIFKAR